MIFKMENIELWKDFCIGYNTIELNNSILIQRL